MRYDSKPLRSQSYLHNFNKENKENQNLLNIKQNKPLKPKTTLPDLVKLNKIPIESDPITNPPKPLLKDCLEPLDLKKQYSQQTGEHYSSLILRHLCDTSSPSKDFLLTHDITPQLRSKMIDWMIEVLSSYKMNEDSFFRSVKIMDRFLHKSEKKQEVKDLHLIGVSSMWTACKYE